MKPNAPNLLVSLWLLSLQCLMAIQPSTVPAYPSSDLPFSNQTCRLDLSAELFGGVGEACGRSLDRSRCCPVLAAWLFAAHARFALDLHSYSPISPSTSPLDPADDSLPMMPDSDSQRCVAALHGALASRDIRLPRPNATCDTVLCFCGIRLHELGSLSCPAAFTVSENRNATPTAALKGLEVACRNASYAGCTRCLGALQKVRGGGVEGMSGDRGSRMMKRDCELMGLTWLLARNKTAYIPTVSAVLRAILYSAHPQHYKCSPDQENMPLAVDSLQFDHLDPSSSLSSQTTLDHYSCTMHVLPILVLVFLLPAAYQYSWL
ncbi:putative SPARK domain-containing protein [Dioscorea sansibarensis]